MKIKCISLAVVLFALSGCGNSSINETLAAKGEVGMYEHSSTKAFVGRSFPVYYYIPTTFDSSKPLQIIMHGADRNGDTYLGSWIEISEKYGIMIAAPSFSKSDFPLCDYQEGNVVDELGNYNESNQTIYALIDEIYEYLLANSCLRNKGYNIFGHSAGGQFVHRFMMFFDSPYVKKGVAANSGWYTTIDSLCAYPYGTKDYASNIRQIDNSMDMYRPVLKKDLTILLGTADTLRNSSLRMTPEADAQGLTRLARGMHYYEQAANFAKENGLVFNWKIDYVEGSGHNHRTMSPKAAIIMYGESK